MNHLAIVVGDITDHGGSVISGAKTFFIDNVAVAHIGCKTASASPEACSIAKAGARGKAAKAPLPWT